jgi:hypothetical protein
MRIHIALALLLGIAAANYPHAGTACITDSDCAIEYEVCTVNKVCKHKNLFPMRAEEIGGLFLFVFLVTFSNIAGIAGSFALLALLLLFNFTVPVAIILSNAQIVISAFIRICSGLGKPHPLKDPHGTLYHFQIISLMLPMVSLGAAIASMVGRVLPDVVVVVIYFVSMVGVLLFNLNRLKIIISKETAPVLTKPLPLPSPIKDTA